MNYPKKIIVYVATLLLTGAAGFVPAQQMDFNKVEIRTVPVRDGIYMLMGAGGNIGVSVGADGVYMIDDQFAPLTEKIRAAIASLSDAPVRFVINTHWHGDHTGGNENLGKEGAVIVAHDNVRRRMSVENFSTAFNQTVPPSPEAALPEVTFNDTATFHLNDETAVIFHVRNAHTDGDSIIHFKEANVVHTGDTWVNGAYPYIDLLAHGSVDGVIAAQKEILDRIDNDTLIIPGHGELGRRSDLERDNAMLVEARKRIQKLIDEGRNLDEIIAMRPLAEYDARYGNGLINPETILRIFYGSLTRE